MPAPKWQSRQWPNSCLPSLWKSPMGETVLSNSNGFSLTPMVTVRSLSLRWARRAWQLSVPCPPHSREGNSNSKPAENGQSIGALWLCRAFFTPLHYPSVTLCRPQTEAGDENTYNDGGCSPRAGGSLDGGEGIWQCVLIYCWEKLRSKTWGTCIKPEPELGCRSLIPCPYVLITTRCWSSSAKFGVYMLFRKSKRRSAPLRSDTANPQAGNIHEAAPDEGSAGKVTSCVHSSKKRHSSFRRKQNSNCEHQNLIVNCQTLPTAMSNSLSCRFKTFWMLALMSLL